MVMSVLLVAYGFAGVLNSVTATSAPGSTVLNFDNVLFLGDSDIEYWDTQSAFPGASNVGVAGWTCQNVYNNLFNNKKLVPTGDAQPRWVVLVCGENDLDEESAAVAFTRFKKIVTALTARGIRVLYLGTKPEPATFLMHWEYREYDASIRAYASDLAARTESPPLVMVDVYPAFEELGNPAKLYDSDDIHLGAVRENATREWICIMNMHMRVYCVVLCCVVLGCVSCCVGLPCVACCVVRCVLRCIVCCVVHCV